MDKCILIYSLNPTFQGEIGSTISGSTAAIWWGEKKIDTNSAHSLKYAQVTDLLVTLTLWRKHLQSAQGEALQNHWRSTKAEETGQKYHELYVLQMSVQSIMHTN